MWDFKTPASRLSKRFNRDGPLANGQHVEVTAQWVAGELIARKVEVEQPSASAKLTGPISDFVSKADFRVAGVSARSQSGRIRLAIS